jgi:NADPH:quinone reductase-like Zn-dependent oxidoreductase
VKTRAIVIEDFGDQPHVVELDVPDVGAGELRVRVHAVSLNAFDWKAAEGRFRDNFTYEFPVTLGRDFAGVVEEVGDGIDRIGRGDAVVGYFTGQVLGRGAFAEWLVLRDDECFVRKPDELSFVEAACLPLSGMVGRRCVEAVAPDRGERHLVIGAPGGIGSLAVQMLVSRGAHVIATGLPEDESYLRELGASEVVDHRDGFAGLEGLDGLIDLVSYRPEFMEHVALLKSGGRAASTHRAADPEALEPLGVAGVNVHSGPDRDLLAEVVASAAAGDLRVPLRETLRIEDAPGALARLRDAHTRGKVALQVVAE